MTNDEMEGLLSDYLSDVMQGLIVDLPTWMS